MIRSLPTATVVALLAAHTAAAPAAAAQTDSAHAQKTFFVAHDARIAGEFLIATAAISLFDAKIAKNFQDSNYFHVRVGRKLDDVFTHINETTLTVGGLGVYAVARLLKQRTVAEVALHVAESVASASIAAQLIRGPLGRTRPRDADRPYDDQYDFNFMHGFTHFEQRAFPSIHSGSGFAAASAIVEEVNERHPGAGLWVSVPMYALAATPGLSRMYLGQHWASDIFAGAYLGTFFGHRVVSYSRSHPTTPVDKLFLGTVSGLKVGSQNGVPSISWNATF